MLEISYDGSDTSVRQDTNPVGLDEIVFYISKQFYSYSLFIVIQQSTQLEILELKQINSTKRLSYSYKVEYYPVKLKNGNCSVQIFGVNLENGKTFISDKVNVKIINEQYNFKASIYMVEKFNKISSTTYEKMLSVYNKFVELSNININVLNEIERGNLK